VHRGEISDATWRAADNPHYLDDTVFVAGQLRVDPGTLVCAFAGAMLAVSDPDGVSTLHAEGTAAQPITFKPAAPSERWEGIRAGFVRSVNDRGTIRLRYVRVESASRVGANYGGAIDIEDSHFRQTHVDFNRTMLRSVVDTGNVGSGGGRFENNVIRGGSLTLSQVTGGSPIHLSGGRIEGSPNIALFVGTSGGIPPVVTADKPLRIVGSRGTPVLAYRNIFHAIWPTREAQDSLLGNANDTLVIWDTPLRAATPANLIVRRELPWVITFDPLSLVQHFHVDTMTVDAGGSLKLIADLRVIGRITAIGTPASPIHIAGPAIIYLVGAAQSQFTNVIFDNVQVVRVAQ
jgi:hypothetical protein